MRCSDLCTISVSDVFSSLVMAGTINWGVEAVDLSYNCFPRS